MNIKIIIAGAIGLVTGGVGGYLLCNTINKAKTDKAISDGVQAALDEIRGNQREKIMENETKKSRIINAIPHFDAKDVVKDIVNDNGYVSSGSSEGSDSSEDSRDVKEPDDEPDSDDDGLPFEEGDIEEHNIWDENESEDSDAVTQEEYDDEQESKFWIDIAKLDPKKKPYEITQDQYNNELEDNPDWDKVTWIFFTDNVFAERAASDEFVTMSATETEIAIGKDNVKKFIEDRSLERMFVRNNKLHLDYEIVRSPRSYSSAIHEEDDED